ncbi:MULTISPECIES: hypothetical protein [unclassified Microbacterium]|uniref:hypothetical protein n=1 Tax=unclassified Microbacterium TaxID=2609290 RepID=UPI003426C307
MTVQREVTLNLAAAEMNDEFGVDVDFMGAREALTTAEAREFAEEIIAAADEADAAAIDHAGRPIEPAAHDLLDRVGSRFAEDSP